MSYKLLREKTLTKKILIFVITFLFLLISWNTYANNIIVNNASLVHGSPIEQYSLVQFSVSWENSWRTSSGPSNWDAAWVFVKFRVIGTGENGNYVSSPGATSSSTTITVSSTEGLRVGMPVKVTSGTGVFSKGTIVTAVTSSTIFTVSSAPTTPLSGSANVVTGYSIWEHAKINTTGFNAPAGSTITPATDGTGAFIYRSANGTGTFSLTNVQLRWDYGLNGVSTGANVDIQVFAIEMVYVPQGAFSLGSGGSETGAFYKYPTTTNPYVVSSENSITISATNNNLYYTASSNGGDRTGTLSASYPKGYAAFYCMKYEIMQQAYVDFLNSLSYKQQETRTANSPSSASGTAALVTGNVYRSGIDIMTPGVNPSIPAIYACNLNGNTVFSEPGDGQFLACDYIMWDDLAAYLDWCGLRPMTELEFEKACRGTQTPVANEFVWGTTGIANSVYTLGNSGLTNESIGTNYRTNVGNALYDGTSSSNIIPMRVGIFAGTSGNTGRVTSGATFYGIMEMAGNMWERPVSVGCADHRSFTGLHGNGILDRLGSSDVANWPSSSVGAGFRGGSWRHPVATLKTSDRWDAATVFLTRDNDDGGRGVRTAP